MKRISLIAPLYNEKPVIQMLAQTLSQLAIRLAPDYELECILVDDGSRDGTSEEAAACFGSWPRVVLLKHDCNRGPGAAMRTGFAKATGDLVCTIDSDCTFDPMRILQMVHMLESQPVDLVTASPYHPDGGVENVAGWRLFLSRGASFIYSLLSPAKLYTYTSFVRTYRRQVVETVSFKADGFVAFPEILLRAIHQGYRVGEVPVVLRSRTIGVSKMKVTRTVRTHLALMARALWWRITLTGAGSTMLAKHHVKSS